MLKQATAAAVTLVLAAGCTPKDDTPQWGPGKVSPNPTTIIDSPAAVVCTTSILNPVREQDEHCDKAEVGFQWVYIKNLPTWPKTLPAVGERIAPGRVWTGAPPSAYLRIPPEGGTFK